MLDAGEKNSPFVIRLKGGGRGGFLVARVPEATLGPREMITPKRDRTRLKGLSFFFMTSNLPQLDNRHFYSLHHLCIDRYILSKKSYILPEAAGGDVSYELTLSWFDERTGQLVPVEMQGVVAQKISFGQIEIRGS